MISHGLFLILWTPVLFVLIPSSLTDAICVLLLVSSKNIYLLFSDVPSFQVPLPRAKRKGEERDRGSYLGPQTIVPTFLFPVKLNDLQSDFLSP